MSNFVFIFYCCIINNYKGGIQVKKAELLKLEEVMEFADEPLVSEEKMTIIQKDIKKLEKPVIIDDMDI